MAVVVNWLSGRSQRGIDGRRLLQGASSHALDALRNTSILPAWRRSCFQIRGVGGAIERSEAGWVASEQLANTKPLVLKDPRRSVMPAQKKRYLP
jgi:hypothetical protein